MRPSRNSAIVLAAAAIISAGYFAFIHLWPPALAFAPRSTPPGFRDLVLDRTVSVADPMLGVPDL